MATSMESHPTCGSIPSIPDRKVFHRPRLVQRGRLHALTAGSVEVQGIVAYSPREVLLGE